MGRAESELGFGGLAASPLLDPTSVSPAGPVLSARPSGHAAGPGAPPFCTIKPSPSATCPQALQCPDPVCLGPSVFDGAPSPGPLGMNPAQCPARSSSPLLAPLPGMGLRSDSWEATLGVSVVTPRCRFWVVVFKLLFDLNFLP